ncbi:uncharacterized protein Bfra_001043 [Botrytis fragariae]|uniref:Uncharacterized protein n=1 Tax=Botrytis fragariae TaxID=1964551 RepID=A0A8H6B4J8_9HELO|nr:uncharacterized protein Bfra_001043 [Botrytis fragariae]KAF5878872.1 hypothetical protein Bfra_001043 [Botrytis fragariae]
MHHHYLLCFLLTLFTFILPTSASPLYYSPSSRDDNQIRSTLTTTCLSDYFGGCCAVDEYGGYGSCTNATLLGSNVPWTGMPTTQTANEWACTNPVNGTVISAGCCTWSSTYVCLPFSPTPKWDVVFSSHLMYKNNNKKVSTNHLPKKIDTTYPNGVVIPTLQKSMACTASNAGLSKSKRMEDRGGVMNRGWGDVWSFW